MPPLSPGAAARRLPLALEALRRCAERLATSEGTYLYQHHDDLTAARRQLDMCATCLPALLSGGAGQPGSHCGDHGHNAAPQLLEASACCWVRLLGCCRQFPLCLFVA
jgi:hypothetical protein